MGYLKDSGVYYPERTPESPWVGYRDYIGRMLDRKFTLERVERVRGVYLWEEVSERDKDRAVSAIVKFLDNPTELTLVGLMSNWPLRPTFEVEVEPSDRAARDLPYLRPRKVFEFSREVRERILAALEEAEKKG